MVNFTLSGLNQNFTLGVSGELAAAAAAVLDVSATAVYNIKLSDMLNVFKFQSDSFDVNDISASDIKYYVFSENPNWPTNLVLNPANADMSGTPIFATGGDIEPEKNKVKHDFVRYLALKLFNTAYGVDLFSNEDALLSDLVSKGATAHAAIKTALAAVNTTAVGLANTDANGLKYATNALTGETNFSRELLRQVAYAAAPRFAGIDNSGGIQSIPLQADDTINFKVSISAATNQHELTSRTAPFDIRVYKIILVLKDTDSPINTVPVESDSASAYPYYTS